MSIDSAMDNVTMEVEELDDNEEEEDEEEEEDGEDENEEDEDIDFNPFIRDNSPEASSSLSSENECVHGTPLKPQNETHIHEEDEEEIIVQSSVIDSNVASSMQVDEEPCTKASLNIELDEEEVDAISRRTRARHSLANYTLEELETFLQESDDERDLPNVDDQEEYRKFLAAVLLEEGDTESQGKVNEIVDEDEDNDADFELELEEALMDSDVDENLECNDEENARRVTRQKNIKNSNNKDKDTLLCQAKVPLRPILPYGCTPQASHIQLPHPQVYQNLMPPIYGFAPNQVGQLHCLIHEHVQLLIQIFSVCVLDITRKDIASEYRKMILEIMSRREGSLAAQKVAYPDYFFRHPHVYPSYQDSNTLDWAPQINNPVLSVLDVAPLRLAKDFMNDVNNSVLDQRQSSLDAYKTYLRAPLFELPQNDPSLITSEDSSGPTESKKSLASILIDRTKKQSVALVPINIVRLAQVFYPLFNAALFPYKPPPQAVVNRILFTESEDGLLAMGYMLYNHDWKAIRQRFLPCKTENQIFVRHKNRLSSNAPDNPIKTIRCIKTSPLTPEEKASISEASKVLKHDWMAIWKYVVPHKDPALLPRLWRIANGTQKSYKKSEHAKQKRRLYDIKRRKLKASTPDDQTAKGKKHDTGDVDGDDETYVHEAFLADSTCKNTNKNNTQIVEMSPSNNNHTKQNCTSTVKGSSSLMNKCPPQKPQSNLVRLAPNLPPVNLPASVTVIRQAEVVNNNNKILDKTCTVVHSDRVGSFLSNSWHNLNNANTSITVNQPGAEENTTDSFLMHPLLFQNPPSYIPNFSARNPDQSASAAPAVQHTLTRTAQNDEVNGRTPSSNERRFIDLNVRLSSESDDEEMYHNVEEVTLNVGRNLNGRLEKEHSNGEDVVVDDGDGIRYTGDVGYDSIPGIVMEQEELSDSDEDVDNVEFEREEIDDSEDEIGDEHSNGLQNKEISFFPSKEVEIQASQSRESRYKRRTTAQPKAESAKTRKPSKNKNTPSNGRRR